MKILVGTNLFYPLYGGGEKCVIDWFSDFVKMGHEVTVITTMPDIIGYEKEFPFEVIRLNPAHPYNELIGDYRKQTLHMNSQYALSLSNTALDKRHYSMLLGLEKIKDREFDIYIGYGKWGSCLKQEGLSFCSVLKEKYPHIITLSLIWEYNTGGLEWDSDMFLSCSPYDLTKNIHLNETQGEKKVLIPKQNTFEPISDYDYSEWKKRPYDFIFNNLVTTKGAETLYNLIQKLPKKKFLVKRGNWGEDKIYYDRFKELENVDIVDWVESMENDFFRKGRYLLYPSVLEGFGLMPMEAAMQGTIPICSDIDILRYSSAPHSIFVYSEYVTNNPFNIINNREELHKFDWEKISDDWIEKIQYLDDNEGEIKEIYNSLRLVKNTVDKRYESALTSFLNSFK